MLDLEKILPRHSYISRIELNGPDGKPIPNISDVRTISIDTNPGTITNVPGATTPDDIILKDK